MVDKIVVFMRSLDVGLFDWQHLAVSLWLWAVLAGTFHVNAWWIGPLFGIGMEAFQYFTFDKRDLHLLDRIGDVGAYSVTVAFLLPSGWIVAGTVVWYLLLWGYRRLEQWAH